MPIFNCFLKIVWKNKFSLLIFVVLFSALVVIISQTTQSQPYASYEDSQVPIAVIDSDQSELSAALVEYINSRHELVELPNDKEKLQDALFYRNVEYILFIPEGFQSGLLGGLDGMPLENVKLHDSISGIYIDNQIDGYISTLKAYLNAEYVPSEAVKSTLHDMETATAVTIQNNNQKQQELSPFYFQFLPYTLLALIINALGPVLIAFNRSDLSKRIESSSFRLRERNMQIALGCVATSLCIWIVLIAVSLGLYGDEILSSIGMFRILNSAVYLAVCVCIAFLVGQFAKSGMSLAAASNVVSLGMSFLCGVFVPQELLGSGVLSAAKFLPAYWYIKTNDMMFDIIEAGMIDMKVYKESIFIQLGFAAAIFAVALVVSRQKKLGSVA